MKYSEFNDEVRADIQKGLSEMNRETRFIMLDIGKETLRFLLLINTGSAVALLTYLGSSAEIRKILSVWIALGIFCVGIIAVSAVTARKMTLELAKDTKNFFDDEITFTEFSQRRPVIKAPLVPTALGLLAFTCFIGATFVALWGLYPVVTAEGFGTTAQVSPPEGSASSSIIKPPTPTPTTKPSSPSNP